MQTAHRLNVIETLHNAIVWTWHQRRAIAARLAVPLFVLLPLCGVASYYVTGATDSVKLLFIVGYLMLFVLIAVNCHRAILMDDDMPKLMGMPMWSMRETKYVLVLIVIAVIAAIASLVVMLPAVFLGIGLKSSSLSANLTNIAPTIEWALKQLSWLAAGYVKARFVLMLPTIALNRRISFAEAFRLSRHNGWRLFVVVLLLPAAMTWLTGLLLRDGATVIEHVLVMMLWGALLLIETAALSLSYVALSNSAKSSETRANSLDSVATNHSNA